LSVESGAIVEWSFAWPGKGMSLDCCILLTSDFAADVVSGVSLLLPAGTVPTNKGYEDALEGLLAACSTTGTGSICFEHPDAMQVTNRTVTIGWHGQIENFIATPIVMHGNELDRTLR
jgi:hypothetical protein